MNRRFLALTLFAALLVVSFTGTAYGHGLGEDISAPASIGDRQITVSGKITPAAVPLDNSAKPTLLIRTFDQNTNATIAGIDYKIGIKLGDEVVLEQRFRSSDGIVLANLIPDETAESAQISGHAATSPDDQIPVSQGSPLEIRSKILTKGGLYEIDVTVEQSSPGLALDRDLMFRLFISVTHAQIFQAETADGDKNIVVKTYYDDVQEFDYRDDTILFSMPFDWDLDYVSQVPILHMEVQFPRSIAAMMTNSYNGTLNGISLPTTSIQIDDYASEENRIVHFVVPNDRLTRIAQSLEDGTTSAEFALAGADRPRFPVDLFTAPTEKYLLQLSWGPEVIETGIPITFVMNVQDPVTGDLIRGANFDFVISQGGTEVYRQHLRSDLGTFAHDYTFSRPGTATFSASNINGEGENVRLDLVVLQGTGSPAPSPNTGQQPQSGCLIATAAFGSELTPQVQYLRNFREQYILSTVSGSAFMNSFNSVYYSFSPQVADYERNQPWLQSAVRAGLYPLFGILMAAERAHFGLGGGEVGSIVAGMTASSLIGTTYLLPAGIALTRKASAKWIVLAMGGAGILLLVAMMAVPSLLPISTAVLVVVFAGSAALLAAKPIVWLFKRN